jgi:hypothetical protein
MPGAIGSIDASGADGAFWAGMTEYLERGAEGLDEVLADIEAAWP